MSSSLFKSPALFSSFFLTFIFLLTFSSSAQLLQHNTCSNYLFSDANRVYNVCNDLPVLNSFLYWNFNPSTRIVEIAYRHTNITSSTWVAWAIDPTSTGMIGAQAFVAFQTLDGLITAYTSPLTSYKTQLQKGTLSFPVLDVSATYTSNEIIIFATFQLQNDNITMLNHVWQDGLIIDGTTLAMHRVSGPNVQSFGSLDLLSGCVSNPTKRGARPKHIILKNVHGLLNAVSWGILIPSGGIIARYLNIFDLKDAWCFHMACQVIAYVVGVGGWVCGVVLGNLSSGVQHSTHRNLGIVLFVLATLHVLPAFKRPEVDAKYRSYWNSCHHLMGYVVIVLSIINVLKGIAILEPEKKWKIVYILVISILGIIAATLELYFSPAAKEKNETAAAQPPPP